MKNEIDENKREMDFAEIKISKLEDERDEHLRRYLEGIKKIIKCNLITGVLKEEYYKYSWGSTWRNMVITYPELKKH